MKNQIIENKPSMHNFDEYIRQTEPDKRETAVFLIKYLRKLGFKNINNDLFAQHSWYFRNALVRANYADISRNIAKTEIYLNRFLANLVFGENNILKNRELENQ